MGMLLRVEAGKLTKEINKEQLKAIPEFSRLTEQQITYVILVTDYHSPYRQHPEPMRKRLSALHAGYKLDQHNEKPDVHTRELLNGEVESVQKAIAKYKELQYDEDIDSILVLQTQIRNIKNLVLAGSTDPQEMKKINDLLTSIPDLRAAQRKLQQESGIEFVPVEEDSNNEKELSTVDRYNMEQMSKT